MQNPDRLNTSDLNQQFLERIRAEFGDCSIEIVISSLDETDYLLASPAHRTRLLQAIENIQHPEHRVEVTWDNLA